MRPEKQLLLDEIQENIDASSAFIIMSYPHVAPDLSWDFREKLRENGAKFSVVKKRIFYKAAESAGISLEMTDVKGNVGVVFLEGDKTIEGTKAVFSFNKEQGELFTILSGRYDEKMYSPSDVKELSKLPSMDEMRAQFIGLLEAPMTQTLSVMEGLLTSVMHCLENKSKESN